MGCARAAAACEHASKSRAGESKWAFFKKQKNAGILIDYLRCFFPPASPKIGTAHFSSILQ